MKAANCQTSCAPDVARPFAMVGHAMLPGLTRWLESLSPLHNAEAWEALANTTVSALLHGHADQRRHFFLNDEREIDAVGQLSIEFRAKPEKSYLTVVEGAAGIAANVLLPGAVQDFLGRCQTFIGELREYFATLLPPPTLQTLIKLRVFDYHASDLLVEMRPPTLCPHAMRPHVDGSVVSLVVAPSDGLLRLQHRGKWHAALHPDGKPFALLMPGIAAKHDLGFAPTPHMVLPGIERRCSVTAFCTPRLGHTSAEDAQAKLRSWRLWYPRKKSTNPTA